MYKIFFVLLFITCISTKANCQTVQGSSNTTQIDSTPSPKVSTIQEDDRVFTRVEKEAEFVGGTAGWIAYLQLHLNANIPAKKGAPAGTYHVIVRFIVSKDGKVKNVEATTNCGYGMEDEVIKIIKKGPKWIPAEQNGSKVNAYRIQPVTFIVDEK